MRLNMVFLLFLQMVGVIMIHQPTELLGNKALLQQFLQVLLRVLFPERVGSQFWPK